MLRLAMDVALVAFVCGALGGLAWWIDRVGRWAVPPDWEYHDFDEDLDTAELPRIVP